MGMVEVAFPKDVQALSTVLELRAKVILPKFWMLYEGKSEQKYSDSFQNIEDYFKGDLKGIEDRNVGLAFKARHGRY